MSTIGAKFFLGRSFFFFFFFKFKGLKKEEKTRNLLLWSQYSSVHGGETNTIKKNGSKIKLGEVIMARDVEQEDLLRSEKASHVTGELMRKS